MARSPESVGRWLRLGLLSGWAVCLLLVLWSVAYLVRGGTRPGFVLVGLVSLACAWLLVVVRQLPP